MQFISTRGRSPTIGFSAAITHALAPDGGLYVPAVWPVVAETAQDAGLVEVAHALIAPFLHGDALESQLPQILAETFDFEVPLTPYVPDAPVRVLELFHGPTAAFKDFGARFLAACIARLRRAGDRPLLVLVATSGDTGGAVAAAFHRRPGVEVAVLFPRGLVSPTQHRQLTCWGDNVRSFAIDGTFDDCQRLVKAAFGDAALGARFELSSANSINLGRLLPQAAYHANAALALSREFGAAASFIIPSGNLGNALACVWARRIGLPIADIVLAHNANRTVPDFLESGTWRPRASVATLASAMDVGDPSNMERLRSLHADVSELRGAVSGASVDDVAIRARIAADADRSGRIWCPHSAVAAQIWWNLPESERRRRPWLLVATAHPAKFREIVEPIIGAPVPLPRSLAELYTLPSREARLPATSDALREALLC